jgi:hypothetical protein
MIWFACARLEIKQEIPVYLDAYLEVCVTVKSLHWRRLGRVEDIPVVNGALGDQSQCGLADPLPEGHVLTHRGRLEFLFLLEVEDLQSTRLRLEGDNLARPVHDGTVGLDRPADDIVPVLELDDEDFGRRGLVFLVPDADE